MKQGKLFSTMALAALSATSCTVVKTEHHITLDHNIKMDFNMSSLILPKTLTHINSPTNIIVLEGNATQYRRVKQWAHKESNETLSKVIDRYTD
jgi:hypothetical protein